MSNIHVPIPNSLVSLAPLSHTTSPQKVTVMTISEQSDLDSPPECLTEIEDVTVTPYTDTIRVMLYYFIRTCFTNLDYSRYHSKSLKSYRLSLLYSLTYNFFIIRLYIYCCIRNSLRLVGGLRYISSFGYGN